jgi:hypothetical protein
MNKLLDFVSFPTEDSLLSKIDIVEEEQQDEGTFSTFNIMII